MCVQYRGGYHEYRGGIMINVGEYLDYRGGVQYLGRYHEYRGDIMSTVGEYLESRGESFVI